MPLMFEFPQMHMAISFLVKVRHRFPQHKAELKIVRAAHHLTFLHTNGVPHALMQPWVDVERKYTFENEAEIQDLADQFGSTGCCT